MKTATLLVFATLGWCLSACNQATQTSGDLWTSAVPAVPYVPLPATDEPTPQGSWQVSTVRRFPVPEGLGYDHRGNTLELFNGRWVLVIEYISPNDIFLYDWETSELIRRIRLAQEGPDAMAKPYSTSIVSPDSLWVHAADYFRFSLLDDRGQVLRRFDLSSIGTDQVEASAYSWRGSAIHAVSEGLVFIWGAGNYSSAATRYTQARVGPGHRVAGLLHPAESPEVIDLPLAFPEAYYDQVWLYSNDVHPRWDWDGETVYLSFPISARVFRYRLGEASAASRSVRSEFLPETIAPLTPTAQLDEAQTVLDRGFYGNIHYDRWHQRIYRLVVHPGTDAYQDDGTYTQPYDYTYSVQVMDSSLRLLGEYPIPSGKLDPSKGFVTPIGLCFPHMHPDYPGLKEDEMAFTCYQWMPKE